MIKCLRRFNGKRKKWVASLLISFLFPSTEHPAGFHGQTRLWGWTRRWHRGAPRLPLALLGWSVPSLGRGPAPRLQPVCTLCRHGHLGLAWGGRATALNCPHGSCHRKLCCRRGFYGQSQSRARTEFLPFSWGKKATGCVGATAGSGLWLRVAVCAATWIVQLHTRSLGSMEGGPKKTNRMNVLCSWHWAAVGDTRCTSSPTGDQTTSLPIPWGPSHPFLYAFS